MLGGRHITFKPLKNKGLGGYHIRKNLLAPVLYGIIMSWKGVIYYESIKNTSGDGVPRQARYIRARSMSSDEVPRVTRYDAHRDTSPGKAPQLLYQVYTRRQAASWALYARTSKLRAGLYAREGKLRQSYVVNT